MFAFGKHNPLRLSYLAQVSRKQIPNMLSVKVKVKNEAAPAVLAVGAAFFLHCMSFSFLLHISVKIGNDNVIKNNTFLEAVGTWKKQ